MVVSIAHARARLHRQARTLAPAAAARRGAWLVLAPHPDDEGLGVGGSIAARGAIGERAMAFLLDGAANHQGTPWCHSRRADGLWAGPRW